jgi:O-antigen/teichoic acid export membrane protein
MQIDKTVRRDEPASTDGGESIITHLGSSPLAVDGQPELPFRPSLELTGSSSTHDERRAGAALLWRAVQMGGTKILYLVGTLVLSRILTPDDFGLVAIAAVVIVTAMFATDTGMTSALVQLSTRTSEHYHLAWSINVLRGVCVAGIILLLAPWLTSLFAEPRAAPLLQLIALKPLIDGLGSPRLADLVREFRFRTLAAVEIVAVAVELVVSIMLAAAWGGMAIIIGRLAGSLALTVASYAVAPWRPSLRLRAGAARELIAFGRWMFAIGLSGVAVELVVQVLVSRQLGAAQLGVLMLAGKLAWAPTQFGAEAVASTAFPLYARLRGDDARLGLAFQAHIIGVMMLLLPVTGLVIGMAQPLENHVLGAGWNGTAAMIAYLACAYSLRLVIDAIVPLTKGLGRARQLFLLKLLEFAVLLTAVSTLIGTLRLASVAAGWALGGGIASIAAIIWARNEMRVAWRWIAHRTIILLLISAIIGLVAHWSAIVLGGASGAIVAGVIGVGIGVLLLAGSERWLRTDFRYTFGTFFPRLAPRSATIGS